MVRYLHQVELINRKGQGTEMTERIYRKELCECGGTMELMKFQARKVVGTKARGGSQGGYTNVRENVGELEMYWLCRNSFSHKAEVLENEL